MDYLLNRNQKNSEKLTVIKKKLKIINNIEHHNKMQSNLSNFLNPVTSSPQENLHVSLSLWYPKS
jgi:hypothetical protein